MYLSELNTQKETRYLNSRFNIFIKAKKRSIRLIGTIAGNFGFLSTNKNTTLINDAQIATETAGVKASFDQTVKILNIQYQRTEIEKKEMNYLPLFACFMAYAVTCQGKSFYV